MQTKLKLDGVPQEVYTKIIVAAKQQRKQNNFTISEHLLELAAMFAKKHKLPNEVVNAVQYLG